MTQSHVDLDPPPPVPQGGLRVIPLGGLGAIGRNMTVFEYDGKLLVVDCGVLFPDVEQPGVDLILPDFSWIRDRLDAVEAVVLTHGHEDHIGALPFFLREFGTLPVYASKLTLGLLRAKLEEHDDVDAELIEVEAGERIKAAPFDFEFAAMNHSIPDSLAVAVHTSHGTILHTGAFKLDQTPIAGRPTDRPTLPAPGDQGAAAAASSPIVLPVTVIASPWRMPASWWCAGRTKACATMHTSAPAITIHAPPGCMKTTACSPATRRSATTCTTSSCN